MNQAVPIAVILQSCTGTSLVIDLSFVVINLENFKKAPYCYIWRINRIHDAVLCEHEGRSGTYYKGFGKECGALNRAVLNERFRVCKLCIYTCMHINISSASKKEFM